MRFVGVPLLTVAALCSIAVAEEENPPRRDALQVSRDGTFLPLTLTARIGDQRIIGMVTGGYDTAQGQGATFNSVVEGALENRVALRVGVDYLSGTNQWSPSVGLRVGVLRQEKYGIDLGIAAMYKNTGFSEANGEVELIVSVGRRWNRLALFGNAAFGQGITPTERDAEARVALLYAVHERVNVGFDARARFDLGDENAARATKKIEADFDLVAGPVATVAVGPLALMAQAGVHTLVIHEQPLVGLAALGGVGACF